MKSTKALMADHEIIFKALHVLEAMTTEMKQGKNVDHKDIDGLLRFLREFADGSHHIKEEAIFFPALIQAGLALEEGPLQVMTYEHERSRALAAAMQDSLERNKKDEFILYAGRYIHLLNEHIEKENYVLFDKADQILSFEDDDKLAEAFSHFETTIVSTATLTRLQGLIDALASKYLTTAVGASL